MGVVELYLLFFKFGLLCFGGGYMLVPLLSAELVGPPPAPLTPEMFAHLLSIAQSTPGPIGINTATFVGYTQAGPWGAIIASLGIVSPAVIMMIPALKLMGKYPDCLPVRGFLAGMRPTSLGLIFSAALIFAELSIFSAPLPWREWMLWLAGGDAASTPVVISPVSLLVAAAAFVLMHRTKLKFTWILLMAAACGAAAGYFGLI
ncbi:MAG: chromate transporter [Victivallaceae bacterium]|nr:chromate transporter [Victivallaceae bacterium]